MRTTSDNISIDQNLLLKFHVVLYVYMDQLLR